MMFSATLFFLGLIGIAIAVWLLFGFAVFLAVFSAMLAIVSVMSMRGLALRKKHPELDRMFE